jgi:hypothetical protein
MMFRLIAIAKFVVACFNAGSFRPTCAPTQPVLHSFEVANFNPPARGRRGGMDRNRP